MKVETERLEKELADARQQHQTTLKALAAAEELVKNQSVPSTSNEPILLNLNSLCLDVPLDTLQRMTMNDWGTNYKR